MYACMGFTAFISAMVLCARSQNLVLPVSVRRIHAVLAIAGFSDEGKPCAEARETAALEQYAFVVSQ